MVETSVKLGKLALAIVDYFIESKLGGSFVKKLTAPTDEQIIIARAMHATAERLRKEWEDKRLWIAIFNHLPKEKELLVALKLEVKIFYGHPLDMGFAEVLTKILQEPNEFSLEIIQKAVGEYIAVLTEELLFADKDFRENMRGLADQQMVEILRRVEESLVLQQPSICQNIYDGITPCQVAEDDLQAALARLKKLPVNKIPTPASLPKGSRFPSIRPNPLFVGREEELKKLAGLLKKGESPGTIGQVAVVTGMGGIGKTQLASEFAHRYGQFFAGGVFWLSFSEPELIPSEVTACGAPDDKRPFDIRMKQVLSDWQSRIPRLLIFDNCEDTHLLMKWRPPAGGSRVLITSQQNSWNSDLAVKELPLGHLERSESIALLRGVREDLNPDDPDLNLIAAKLGDLPLAMHMAGSYLHTYRQVITPSEYLEALPKPGHLKQRILKGGEFSPTRYDLKIRRTFLIAMERLDPESDTDRLAVDLLKRIACFAPGEVIPRELIMTSGGKEEVDTTVYWDGVNRLQGLGLVEENESGNVRMHKLVACIVRDTLPDEDALAQVEQAVSAATSDANKSGDHARMQPLLTHLKHLTDQALKRMDEQAAKLSSNLGYYLGTIADYSGAQLYFEEALKIRRNVLGEEHPDTASSLDSLGTLLKAMGKYEGARSYFEQALKIRRKVQGKEHPHTATSFNNLDYLTFQQVVISILLILSLAVTSWQVLAHGSISTTLDGRIPTLIETGIPQSSAIFPGLTSTPSGNASPQATKTQTPTPTASSTATRYLPSSSATPSSTSKPVVIVRTNTPAPSELPPGDTPKPPTSTPTATPTKTPTPIETPTPTAVPPTDTLIRTLEPPTPTEAPP